MDTEPNWWRGRLLHLQPQVKARYKLEGGNLLPDDQLSPNVERKAATALAEQEDSPTHEAATGMSVWNDTPAPIPTPWNLADDVAEILKGAPEYRPPAEERPDETWPDDMPFL